MLFLLWRGKADYWTPVNGRTEGNFIFGKRASELDALYDSRYKDSRLPGYAGGVKYKTGKEEVTYE